VPDMKEITFSTVPGTFVTVTMDFANKHDRLMHFLCHAVPVRFEKGSGSSADCSLGSNYFSVSPPELTTGRKQSGSQHLTRPSRREGHLLRGGQQHLLESDARRHAPLTDVHERQRQRGGRHGAGPLRPAAGRRHREQSV
jgi:hypothetical protein